MKSAYQLLAIIAQYSDIANTFQVHVHAGVVYCLHMAPSGRTRWIATVDTAEG